MRAAITASAIGIAKRRSRVPLNAE
jgi:hypothetical protein